MSREIYFYEKGCYADGCFGHQHLRDKLAILLYEISYFDKKLEVDDIIDSLQESMPDEAWDENEAIDILQNYTKDGLVWTCEAGDLLLIKEEEIDV